jgi:gas vesicle protein
LYAKYEMGWFVIAQSGANIRLGRDSCKEEIMSDNNVGGTLWFLAGLGIGAAVGLLYAPKTGAETRQKIREAAEQGRDVVQDGTQKAREQAGTWADKGRDYLNSQKDQIGAAVDAGRQAYRGATAEEGEGGATKI